MEHNTGALAFPAQLGYGETMEKCLACGKPRRSWGECDQLWEPGCQLMTLYRDDPPQKGRSGLGDGGIECVPLDELYGRR